MWIEATLITLISGVSFLIGYLITKLIPNKKNLVTFSIGFSFTVIIGLIVFDLLPECYELVNQKYLIIVYILAGILLLKGLDLFVPDHDHDDSSKKDHMEHIGLISALALILHNLIEGTAIYSSSLTNTKLGLVMALGVAFHNIPLGIQISSLLKNEKERILMVSGLVLSSVIGVFIINVLKITLTESVLGILISITLGMLLYISLFELLCEIKENIKNRKMLYGIIFGLIVVIISVLM